MSERSFTHLHTHTEFSMLDGAARVGDLVAAAVADGQPALGITDHGNMYGVLDFYKACRDQGVVPIIGTESYMAGESRLERPVRRGRVDDTGGDVEGGQKLYYHLTLLAETVAGYRNLMQLSSAAYLEGYYYKPRVDWELLERHHNGLIATTGCLGGVVLQALLAGDVEGAERKAARLQDIFGRDNLFVELQDHGIADQHRTNPQLIEIARRLGRPAAGHQRQPLHPPRGRGGPRRPSVRADRRPPLRHEPLQVRGHRALPQDGRRDAPSLPRGPRGVRQHAADRRTGRRADRAREAEPARVPGARPLHRRDLRGAGVGVPARPHPGGRPRALRRLPAARGGGAARLRARRHREHGLRRLLPRRVGPDPLRPRVGHPGGARARLGGRLLRGLLPQDRRPRPDPLRPALRALPEPRPQADARHRHGLRRALPRRRHALRGGEVRQRPRGPDHHVLDHQGAGRRARRRPGAGQALHAWATGSPRPCRRSSWGATPRCGPASPRPTGTRTGTRRRPSCGRCTTTTPTPRRSSTSRSASRACGARTASTPPPWSSPGTR